MSCPTGKIVYGSAEDARAYIKASGRNRSPVRGSLRPYNCEHWPYWHLTSMSKSEQRRRFGRS